MADTATAPSTAGTSHSAAVPGLRVGIIGLGTMGGGMASRLLDKEWDVTVHNRTAARSAAWADRAPVAASPAELATRADVVLVSVADEAAVEQVLFGQDGVCGALRVGGVVVDASTVSPDFARATAERAARTGHPVLDARALGNGQHARQGELRFMVGGDPAVFARVRPVLDALGKEVTLLGGHGAGAAMKLVLNMLMGIEMQALAEAVVLGEGAGLARGDILRTIAASGFSSPVMRFKSGVMGRRAFDTPDFRLALMRKDLGLVRAEAQRSGVPLPAAEAAYTALTVAVQHGLGEQDCAAVLALMEDWAGREAPPPLPPGALPAGGPPNGGPPSNAARGGRPS
jgi:3-hydroxyisobutyrate dehydrogenase